MSMAVDEQLVTGNDSPKDQQLFHPGTEPLVKLIESKPEAFATGDAQTASSALEATKFVFDLGMHNDGSY